jgi:phage shock protein C
MSTKKCPYCAEEIQEEAVKCKHCNSWLAQRPAQPALGPPVLPVAGEGRRLLRSSYNRMLGGVCGGMGTYLGVDPTLIRIAYAVCTVFTAIFPGIILYIILLIIIPLDDSVPSSG